MHPPINILITTGQRITPDTNPTSAMQELRLQRLIIVARARIMSNPRHIILTSPIRATMDTTNITMLPPLETREIWLTLNPACLTGFSDHIAKINVIKEILKI